jgi:multidrug efflux pump subunit AcrB
LTAAQRGLGGIVFAATGVALGQEFFLAYEGGGGLLDPCLLGHDLGLSGVVLALIPTGTPMGFVAILGILALIGIIIRNSVILVTQIHEYEVAGYTPWDAVVEATEHRRRPILLTAAAASLGMIPIAREVFWGPMAYAMIGGIIIATLLTLLFLPALYVAWYKIREPKQEQQEKRG